MSLVQILKLIEANPSHINPNTSIEEEIGYGYARQIVDAAERVLNLYRESIQLELSDKQRRALHRRLLIAAGRVQGLIEYDDTHGRTGSIRQQHAQRNLRLFNNIAEELGMEPQALHALL